MTAVKEKKMQKMIESSAHQITVRNLFEKMLWSLEMLGSGKKGQLASA